MVRELCLTGVGEQGICIEVSTGTWESLSPPGGKAAPESSRAKILAWRVGYVLPPGIAKRRGNTADGILTEGNRREGDG